MRLCFYNPHAIGNTMGETVISKLAQIIGTDKKNLKKHNRKHEYLLSFLKENKYNTAIVADGFGTSLGATLSRIKFFRKSYLAYKIVSLVEIYIWCLLNGMNPFGQKIIFSRKKLNEKNDILFSFLSFNEMFLNGRFIEKSIIKIFKGKKILHATHYYGSTEKIAENAKKAGVRHMVAEADLKKSQYFNNFFEFIEDVYLLPNVLREKYKKTKDFKKRKNVCLALGTLVINDLDEEMNRAHCDFFKTDTLHPMRKEIFENRDNLLGIIDCNINFHNKKRLEITNQSRFYKRYNIFRIFYDLFFLSEGKEYHSMDIVDKYNQYKIFVAPEENIGLPSINFSEGMACGCAYIGLEHPMYADLGMINGENYIAYNGTLEDLKDKIAYYQRNQEELSEIAENGYVFAINRFSQSLVMDDFWTYLKKLTNKK